MDKLQIQVLEFHRKFGIFIESSPTAPCHPLAQFRLDLIDEELNELATVFATQDIVEIADAIGDLLMVVYGTAVSCGIDMKPICDEIHRSNMTKTMIPSGFVFKHGKPFKGKVFKEPNLKPIIEQQRRK